MKLTLSPKEFADTINVSESTIKRWVDRGKIIAEKTEGGHRRISIEEAIRVIRDRQLDVKRGDLLGLSDVDSVINETETFETDTDQLYHYLYSGDGMKARGMILLRYLQGHSLAEICDEPMRIAMEQIGELWKSSDEGIYREHRATDICIQALQTAQLLFRQNKTKPLALGGSISGDPYMLPSLAATTVLASEGFKVINLGPNTPFEAFLSACVEHQPQLVWISLSVCNNVNAFTNGLETFLHDVEIYNTQIMVGGKSKRNAQHINHPNLFLGATMSELAGFAKALVRKISREQEAF